MKMRRVAMLLNQRASSITHFHLRTVYGFVAYARKQRNWKSFCNLQASSEEGFSRVEQLPDMGLDGIFVVSTVELESSHLDILSKLDIPIIGLHKWPVLPDCEIAYIRPDDYIVGRRAAHYFLHRGFRNFGFCGPFLLQAYEEGKLGGGGWEGRNPFARKRYEGFRDALQDAGYDCSFIIQEKKGSLEDYYKNISKQYVAKVRDWVKDMPKPVGVMATDDKCGCIVCEACRLEKINVPGQVSVIGVNNDVIRCLFNEPAVSSIDLNFEGIGYRAAEILDQWISGKDYSGEIIQVLPLNVVERLSSTTLGLDDENLRLALSFMRSNFTRNISLDDVAKAGRLSRAVLTRRFHSVLGLTVADEIRRLRLERAEKLLLETDLSLDTIAYETGFKHARYFSDVFRKQNGIPPGQWRKKNALRYPDMSSLSG